MVTHNKELLMAFVYFDQSHCGYLLERDLEEILYTLGLHLSRAQVNTQTHTQMIMSIVCIWICASLILSLIQFTFTPLMFLFFLSGDFYIQMNCHVDL